jgi:hypothetical protein
MSRGEGRQSREQLSDRLTECHALGTNWLRPFYMVEGHFLQALSCGIALFRPKSEHFRVRSVRETQCDPRRDPRAHHASNAASTHAGTHAGFAPECCTDLCGN